MCLFANGIEAATNTTDKEASRSIDRSDLNLELAKECDIIGAKIDY